MSLRKNIILSVVVLLMTHFSFAQTEAETRDKADVLFKNKEYVEATPLYLRLLSLQPRSYEYSFKYGTCLLFNSNRKQDAIRYLTYAIKSPVPIHEAHFFLGKAYHLNYQFNDAVREYEHYLAAAPKGAYTTESYRNIAMCENGKKLLTTVTDIIVHKKTEIRQEDFFRLYDLSEIGGSIIFAVDFQSKNDKKFNHKPIVHISPNMENVYFSSYGEGTNLDIYVARRLPGGKFGVPQKLNGGINTPFDEDFPYMHPNGRELYFSSKGHNSMGGYDIFKALFDADNNTYGDVTNVDFSISSPDDDLLYVVDKESKNAYFSSKRQSQDGKITVYKVAVERIPIQLAIVKGTFHSSIFPDTPKMTVEVFDKTNSRRIGVFNTLKESSYLITFPKGGKYEYKIRVEGSGELFTADVEIPYLKELRPLKQRIDHEHSGEAERIRITNLFNEEFEDAQSIVSQVLKERADLNVNEDQFDSEASETDAAIRTVIAELRLGNLSPMETGQLLQQKVDGMKTDSEESRRFETSSNGIAALLYNDILSIDKEIKELVKEADASESPRRKELVLSNAKELYRSRDEKLQKIREIQAISNEIRSSDPGNSGQNSERLETISKQYDQFLSEGNVSELKTLLENNKDYLLKTLHSQPVSASAALLAQRDSIDTKINAFQESEREHQTEIDLLNSEITVLKEQTEQAKEKQKQAIQHQIDSKVSTKAIMEESLKSIQQILPQEIRNREEVTQKLNTVTAIESYTGIPVSAEELAAVKATVNEDKSRTLKTYVESSFAALSAVEKAEVAESPAEKTIEQYNAASEEIYAGNQWSDYDKQRRMLLLNREAQQELTTYLLGVENNDALNEQEKTQQKAAAQKMIRQLQDDQSSLEKEWENTAKKEISNLKTVEIISEIDPGYREKIHRINDNSLNTIEKLEQYNQADRELIAKITSEIQQMKSEQNPGMNDPLADAKTELLEKHITHLQSAIASKEQEIAQLKDNNEKSRQDLLSKAEIAREIAALHNGKTSDFETVHTSVQDVQKNIEQLKQYQMQLTHLLNELQRPENIQAQYQEVIHKEMVRTENRLAVLETNRNELLLSSSTPLPDTQQPENAQVLPFTAPTEEAEKQETTAASPTPVSVKSGKAIQLELLEQYPGNAVADFEYPYETTPDIEKNIQRLETYISLLNHQLKTNELNAVQEEKTVYRETINLEILRTSGRIDTLKEKLRIQQSRLSIAEIPSEHPVEPVPQTDAFNTTEHIRSRRDEIAGLLLKDKIPKNERRQLNNELAEISYKKAAETTAQRQMDNARLEKEIQRIQDHSGTKDLPLITGQYTVQSARLYSELDRERHPVKREMIVLQIETLNENYYNDLNRMERLIESRTATSDKVRIHSQEQLKSMERRGVIEIEALTLLKAEKNKALGSAGKKEQSNLLQEISILEEREHLVRNELKAIEEQLFLYQPLQQPLPLSENTARISFNEERQIAASEAYQLYATEIAGQNELINRHAELSVQLLAYQNELELLRSSDESTSLQKEVLLEKIKNISLSLSELEVQISNATRTAETHLPTDPDEMMKFQNLVMRGINPLKKSFITTTLIPIAASGIEFNPATSVLPALNTIPVGITTPKGLVYRVQVGAFARPIPESHFREFTPVSGEKIEHSNITRYMAGYFNNAASVIEARNKIRQIGYNDAFIVAYCDGKRITFGEARRMEERKECVGLGINELQLEVATNFAEKLGLEDTTRALKPVSEYAYNQAPGAATATAIEQFDSEHLFYTVQIGVYNRPVEKERLLNLEPLYTLRLENGQIRYSVGMYGDLIKAKHLESEIRTKGISDAFVTAYYQGKRISIDKARSLLGAGSAKLYNEDQEVAKQQENTIPVQAAQEVELFTENKTIISKQQPEVRYIQFLTKETFENYPREQLNRYNVKGNFYYDRADGRIKSSFYPSTDLLPRIAAFSGQMDTLYFSKSEVLKSNDSKVTFILNTNTIPGDLNDWLMKFPYRKSIVRSENGLEIHIFDVRLEDVQEMKVVSDLLAYPFIETQNLKEYDKNNE